MKNPLKETIRALLEHEHTEFLHSPDPMEDQEGEMAKGRLAKMAEMASKIEAALDDDDQLPAWVQDHLTVAYEKMSDAYSYLSTKFDMGEEEEDEEEEEDSEEEDSEEDSEESDEDDEDSEDDEESDEDDEDED